MSTRSDSNFPLDRTAFAVVPAFDETGPTNYWHQRSVEERLRHLELLRRINYGPRATGRLERVFEVVELHDVSRLLIRPTNR